MANVHDGFALRFTVQPRFTGLPDPSRIVPSARMTNPIGALRASPVFAPVVPRMPTRPERAMSEPPMELNARVRALGTCGSLREVDRR